MATQIKEAKTVNEAVLNDEMTNGKQLKVYTWIYRWDSPTEFKYDVQDTLGTMKNTLTYRPDEKKKYL